MSRRKRYDVKGSEALVKFHELIDASEYDTLVAALALGKALRNLTGPQQRALENLLAEFHAHPRSPSPGQYLVCAHNRSVAMNDNFTELDLVSPASQMNRIVHGQYLQQGESSK